MCARERAGSERRKWHAAVLWEGMRTVVIATSIPTLLHSFASPPMRWAALNVECVSGCGSGSGSSGRGEAHGSADLDSDIGERFGGIKEQRELALVDSTVERKRRPERRASAASQEEERCRSEPVASLSATRTVSLRTCAVAHFSPALQCAAQLLGTKYGCIKK